MSQIGRAPLLLSCLCVVISVAAGGRVQAQIPDEFTNLQVLPADIPKRQLVDIMRRFSSSLGVRCTYCHAGKTPGSLEEIDFATDELEHKKIARSMMRMVASVNEQLNVATGRESHVQVGCVTCHRGIQVPESLENVVLAAIEEGGVEAGLQKYRELRAEYYGQGSYAFGPDTLDVVAEVVARHGRNYDDAIRVLQLNVETNPTAAYSYMMLGQLYAQKGDKEAAIANLEQSLEIEPNNPRARESLERLRADE